MPGLMWHGKCTPNHSEPVVTYEIKILGFADLNAEAYLLGFWWPNHESNPHFGPSRHHTISSQNDGFEALSARADAALGVHPNPLRTRSYI